MAKEPNDDKKLDKVKIGVGVGIAASVLLNVVLGAQLLGAGGASDNYTGDNATDKSFYEEQVATLKSDKKSLEEQLATAKEDTATAESSSETAEPEKPAKGTDSTRKAVQVTTDGFLDAFLNNDTSKQTNEQRRALLEPYVGKELLGQLAPNAEELEAMGIEGHAHADHEGHVDGDEAPTPEYTFKQELDEKNIFIQEDTLESDVVKVVVETVSNVEDSFDVEYDLTERYSMNLEQEGDKWVITSYELDQINQ